MQGWEQDIEIWSLFTDLPKENQGTAVFFSLPQNICEYVQHSSITDIGLIDRLWVITDKLDQIYLLDKHTMPYMTFKDFYSNKRTAGVNMNDFLVWYKFLYKNYINLELSCQKVFSSFLFWMQWICQKKTKKMIRTTFANLTYTATKETLKKNFFWQFINRIQNFSCY